MRNQIAFVMMMVTTLRVAPVAGCEGGESLSDGVRVVRIADCEEILGIAFSPDSKVVVAALESGKLVVLDGETGRVIQRVVDRREELFALAYSADGSRLLVAGDGGVARLWRTDNWMRDASVDTGETVPRIESVASSLDGDSFATLDMNSQICIFDKSGRVIVREFGAEREFKAIALEGKGDRFVGVDRKGEIWRVATKPESFTSIGRLADDSSSLRVPKRSSIGTSRDGKQVVAAWGGHVIHFDEQGATRHVELNDNSRRVVQQALSADTTLLISGDADDVVQVLRTDSGKTISRHALKSGRITAVQIAPNNKRFAAGTHRGLLALWPDSNPGK